MLKAKSKITPQVTSDTDMYHSCRWCHYYSMGKCYAQVINNDVDNFVNPVYKVAEDGYLQETLRESVDSVDYKKFAELEYLLRDWGISDKRIKAFNEMFSQCMEEWKTEVLLPQLSDDVDLCYQNNTEKDDYEDGVSISDPENFSCEKWC